MKGTKGSSIESGSEDKIAEMTVNRDTRHGWNMFKKNLNDLWRGIKRKSPFLRIPTRECFTNEVY